MRKCLVAVALTFILSALSGCKGKSITYINVVGIVAGVAQTGQTLEWDLIDPKDGINKFTVTFQAPFYPCGADHSQLIGTPTQPAQCKVTAKATQGNYVAYNYQVTLNTPDQKKTVFPCGNCSGIIAGPISKNGAAITYPTAESVQPHPGSRLGSGSPGIVALSCDTTTHVVTAVPPIEPNVQQSTAVTWHMNSSNTWKVTFDPPPSGYQPACTANPISSDTNGFCTVNANPTITSLGVNFTYSVQVYDGNTLVCSTSTAPGPFALTILPPPTQ